MKINNFVIGLGFLAASALLGQGPIYDRVRVNLPYPVYVSGSMLKPGEYVIQQYEGVGGSGGRTVTFYGDDGMKLDATVVAIPVLDNRTPEETKLVIERVGNEYYLNKIWVQGRNYGYEFPPPPSLRQRQNEQNAPAAVVAQYTPPPAPPTPTIAKNETVVEEKREQAEAAPPAPEPTPAPAPAPPPMPHTASNWVNLALAGGLLMSSGYAIRRARV